MKNGDKKLINILKKFPDKNPNPVIRLSDEGILEYYNNPSKGIVEFYGFKLGSKVSDIFFNEVKKTVLKSEHNFDIWAFFLGMMIRFL